jgi:hypothetical protein
LRPSNPWIQEFRKVFQLVLFMEFMVGYAGISLCLFDRCFDEFVDSREVLGLETGGCLCGFCGNFACIPTTEVNIKPIKALGKRTVLQPAEHKLLAIPS